ncbi:hypothetical protein [Sorangium sp. So ce124]|uniref:hypothetical protein n=1 Tax=Sorangium sp. So ce124 TaxID=3133280 RepID=UPI003F61426E
MNIKGLVVHFRRDFDDDEAERTIDALTMDGALPTVTLCPDGSMSPGGRGGVGECDAGGRADADGPPPDDDRFHLG